MAASSMLLLRLAEFLRGRKGSIVEDSANGCREERHARGQMEETGNGLETFPWRERLHGMVQSASDALLAKAAADGQGRSVAEKPSADSASAGIQALLSEAWLVRNTFLRFLNRFQGEQSNKRVDFTALEMTEARQEALQEFDRAVSGALSEWIAGSKRAAAVPASAVADLYDGMRAIQGLLQLAASSIPAGAKAHVSAAAQQLGRLAASAQSLLEGDADPKAPTDGIAPPTPIRPTAALDLAPLDVATFVRSIAETARPAALKKGLRLEALCNPGPQILKTDGAKLLRAATLLVNYTLSFTEQGEISLISGVDEQRRWTLELRDTSAGAPPEILSRLLQGVAHAPSDGSSTGDPALGVALARDLVTLLGGALTAVSEPGEGNCFTIALPVA